MSVVRGSFAELLHKVTGMSEMNMGQMHGYADLQNAMMQQQNQMLLVHWHKFFEQITGR